MKPPIKIPCGVTVEFDNAMFLQVLNRYGVSGWNAWIDAVYSQKLLYPSYDKTANPPAFQMDFVLRGVDLSGRNLDGIDLTMIYMTHGIFCDASLRYAKLLFADECNFINADLTGASLAGCDVSGAIFIDAKLDDINWDRSFYYSGSPPVELTLDIMRRVEQFKPDDAGVTEPKKIVCLASVRDRVHWVKDEPSQ